MGCARPVLWSRWYELWIPCTSQIQNRWGGVDIQRGKPSSGDRTLECNKTYEANIGVRPLESDISTLTEEEINNYIHAAGHKRIDVLISCAPCTGFSRTIRKNLVGNNSKNSLIGKSADFVEILQPSVFIMENVPELLHGKFTNHYDELNSRLKALGYKIDASVHSLDKFGLPQKRRRSLIIATKPDFNIHNLEELWSGYMIHEDATTVRRAIGHLPHLQAGEQHPEDPWHVSPGFSDIGLKRLSLIPEDGGSWTDLIGHPDSELLLIPSMQKQVDKGKVGPYRDIYGRMAWNKPSVTVKREAAHTGNGRYAHPVQNRLCSVRGMSILQGFPETYCFEANPLSNAYRHVGDAVPPLISFQIAAVCEWILTGVRPNLHDVILPDTHLSIDDIVPEELIPKQPKLPNFA